MVMLRDDVGGLDWLTKTLRQTPDLADRLTVAKAPVEPRDTKKKTGNVKPRPDAHWLTWRTGRTPAPPTPAPRPPSSVRPESSASRFRMETPEVDIDDVMPNLRPPSVKPRPFSVKPRPHSVAVVSRSRNGADSACVVYQDILSNGQMETKPNTPEQPAYMSALKTWVGHADEYERDVAYNLVQVLQSNSVPAATKTRPRAKSAAARPLGMSRMVAGTHRPLPRTAGVRTSHPVTWQPGFRDPAREQFIMNHNARQAGQRGYLEGDPKPVARYSKDGVQYVEHTHPASHFRVAQPPYRSSFTINPEWVSESQPKRLHPGYFLNNRQRLRLQDRHCPHETSDNH